MIDEKTLSEAERQRAARDTGQVEVEEATPYVVFRIGSTWLGFDADRVAEISNPLAVTPVPGTPSHVLGLINLRGRAIPLFDVRNYLEIPEASKDEGTVEGLMDTARVVVVSIDGMRVGIPCAQVLGILEFPASSIGEVQITQDETLRRFALGEVETERGVVTLLDLGQLIGTARMSS